VVERPVTGSSDDHARHDVELIAALAAGDLIGSDLGAAERLAVGCDACAALAADLRSLASALRGLPDAATVASTVPAPFDFRLRPEDAARLRPRSLVARLGGFLAVSTLAFGRPVGLGLATMGLAGLLVANVPLATPAADGNAAAPVAGEGGGALGIEAAPTAMPSPDAAAIGLPIDQGGSVTRDADGTGPATAPAIDPATVLVGGSLGLLAIGVLLIVVGSRPRRPAARSIVRRPREPNGP